jgi:alpha-tubulin suppressor-like RCC1 family protein
LEKSTSFISGYTMLNFYYQKSLALIAPSTTNTNITITQRMLGIVDSLGSPWVAGFGAYGQLGNSTLDARFSFGPLLNPVSCKAITFSYGGAAFLDSNGMIWCVGAKPGDNTDTAKSSPVLIARSSSYRNICGNGYNGSNIFTALDGDGSVWSWGYNGYGMLGNNSTVSTISPVSIIRAGSYIHIAGGGGYNVLAIDGSTGMIWSWGNNSAGQVGDNTVTNRSSPVAIARSSSYIFCVTGGSVSNSHSIAIDALNGSLWSWGNNTHGQVGDNTTTNRSSPVSVTLGGSFIHVAAGSHCSFAVDSNNVLWSWGGNYSGQLGDGTFVNKSSPISIASNVKYVYASGLTDSSTVSTDVNLYDAVVYMDLGGGLWAFGSNAWGQFGLEVAPSCATPKSIPVTFKQRETGVCGTIEINNDGRIWAWGRDDGSGFLGLSTMNISYIPAQVLQSAPYVGLQIKRRISGVIDSSTGRIFMWGDNSKGALGNNSTVSTSSPVSVVGTRSFTKLATCQYTSAAIEGSTGNIYTWGVATVGALGNNQTAVNRSSPNSIARIASYTQVACGDFSATSTCFWALDGATGMVWAWGQNGSALMSGALGTNNSNVNTNASSPVAIARSASYSKLASGQNVAGIIDGSTGMIYCWGRNVSGNVGDGTVISRSSPTAIARSSSYKDLSFGLWSAIALDAVNGSVWGWGSCEDGQIGPVLVTDYFIASPVSIPIPYSAVSVRMTGYTSFIWDYLGNIWAVGNSALGQISTSGIIASPISIGKVILK